MFSARSGGASHFLWDFTKSANALALHNFSNGGLTWIVDLTQPTLHSGRYSPLLLQLRHVLQSSMDSGRILESPLSIMHPQSSSSFCAQVSSWPLIREVSCQPVHDTSSMTDHIHFPIRRILKPLFYVWRTRRLTLKELEQWLELTVWSEPWDLMEWGLSYVSGIRVKWILEIRYDATLVQH